MSSKKYGLSELNSKLQDVDGNYALISRVKYLRKRSSKAITRNYLNAILTDDKVWTPDASTVRHQFHYQGIGAEELLKILEAEVFKLGKTTFLNDETLPDMDWLKNCLLLLLKEDKMSFLTRVPKNFRLKPEESLIITQKKEITILPQ